MIGYWKWCGTCLGFMVICAICGNNCCNGGYGKWPDGTQCTLCPYAYEYQATSMPKWIYVVNKIFSYYWIRQIHLWIFGHPLDRFFKELEKKK